MIPYMALIRQKLAEVPIKSEFVLGTSPATTGSCAAASTPPAMIELIWSYWLEQGMLVQTMNAIACASRTSVRRSSPTPCCTWRWIRCGRCANLMWGWLQDEGNRLTVSRRAYEYEQEYGLTLLARRCRTSSRSIGAPASSSASTTCCGECTAFFQERDDLTVKADGFPLLNSINDVHMILAEGACNQYGDLGWMARAEMMIMQWLLARPEFREFLGGRIMVPYAEPWMDRVDTMRMLQRWGDVSITSFHYLAHYGEQILLSLRFGNWSQIHDAGTAAAWADKWRPAIQTYVHHYRRVTGVDLAVTGRHARTRNSATRSLRCCWLRRSLNSAASRFRRRRAWRRCKSRSGPHHAAAGGTTLPTRLVGRSAKPASDGAEALACSTSSPRLIWGSGTPAPSLASGRQW